ADGPVHDHAEVNLPGDVGGLLDQHLGDLLPLLAGLLGDKGVLEHHLGDLATLLAAADELDPAPVLAAILETALAAAAGVHLGLEDDWGADLVERLLGFGGRGGHDAARDGRAGRRQQFFRLKFVDLHRGYSPEERQRFRYIRPWAKRTR